ncbi:hypothetical protein Taro_050803 [Colocasia esculenta]|uniref:Uncharacterized protein n=1 Tax=Colocasia esculenta TaxID=4460 RepID=A0A843XEB0_COLES|nr:hypothetical protein [Colocasia esculenta]
MSLGVRIRVSSMPQHPRAQVPVPQAQDHGGPSIMERFKRMSPPSFKGERDPLLAESWMREIEKIFRAIRCAEDDKVTLATYMLQERADVGGFRPSYPRAGAQRVMSAGRRDGAVLGGEEDFSEEACSSFPEAGQEEGGFSVTVASCGIGKQSGTVSTRKCIPSLPVCIEDRVLEGCFFLLKMNDYDAILGLDWLEEHYALVDYRGKKIVFCIPGEDEFSHPLPRNLAGKFVIFSMRAMRMVNKGCDAFLASVVLVPKADV